MSTCCGRDAAEEFLDLRAEIEDDEAAILQRVLMIKEVSLQSTKYPGQTKC
jgi:hypothetical protein